MNITCLLTVGLIIGILDWLTDIIFAIVTDFQSDSLEMACYGFIIIHPVFYCFLFATYGISHPNGEKDWKDRIKYIYLSPLYSVMMYIKILPAYMKVYNWFSTKFRIITEDLNLDMFSIESYYRIQIF